MDFHDLPDPCFKSRIDNFRFVEVNERACKNYGYTRAEFLKMRISDIEVVPPVLEEVRKLYNETPIGQVIEVEGTNRRKDGSTFPVHVRFWKVDEKFAVANVRDVTKFDQAGIISLSPRQREVFKLIGKGHGSDQIASSLSISVRTVGAHREAIKMKLQLESSRELIIFASRYFT